MSEEGGHDGRRSNKENKKAETTMTVEAGEGGRGGGGGGGGDGEQCRGEEEKIRRAVKRTAFTSVVKAALSGPSDYIEAAYCKSGTNPFDDSPNVRAPF